MSLYVIGMIVSAIIFSAVWYSSKTATESLIWRSALSILIMSAAWPITWTAIVILWFMEMTK
jgi:cell division protein FtsX